MSFTEWYYLFFLAGVALGFWFLRGPARFWLLGLASYVFYGTWDLRFLGLIMASTVVDYLGALALSGERKHLAKVALAALLPPFWFVSSTWLMGKNHLPPLHALLAFGLALTYILGYFLLWKLPSAQRKKAFLLLSILTSLSILVFFKYCHFFIDSCLHFLALLGFKSDPIILNILLPVGISFYTFQSIAYVVDVYRGQVPACRSLPLFACFVSFFPQLVAGPIERSQQLLPQLEKPKPFRWHFLQRGTQLLLLGYFQKVFVGDNCALVANYVFNHPTELSSPWVLLGVFAFAFQIYGDFAGYTNIARGSALMFGVELSRNFRFPYFAQGPSDFWARWHITLSTWFRDYVYIPLGGNRHGTFLTLRNLFLTMLIAGIWHGAGTLFVCWGIYHGLLLILYRLIPALSALEHTQKTLPRLIAILFMFGLTLGGWMIFRSANVADFTQLFHSLFLWTPWTSELTGSYGWVAFHALPLLLLQAVLHKEQDETELHALPQWGRVLLYLLLFLALASSATGDQEFIYFQF
jgi:alginate O-acetyltransferase complex protein AlgI